MLSNFSGKHVLVTGGNAGIGKAIALAFAANGADVTIWGTNEERLSLAIEEIKAVVLCSDQKIGSQRVDVSSHEEVLSAFNVLEPVHILVNNAGITRDGLLIRMKEKDWDDVIGINLKSVFNLSKAAVGAMMKSRSGAIINISSVVGLNGNPGQANYAASKAGIIGFTKALAKEVASRGIRVNCVAPGFIETNMTGELTEKQKEGIFAHIPLGRMGKPEEIAEAVLFLARAEYITGQVVTVDGGMVM